MVYISESIDKDDIKNNILVKTALFYQYQRIYLFGFIFCSSVKGTSHVFYLFTSIFHLKNNPVDRIISNK